MRVTDGMMTENYLRYLTKSSQELSDLNMKVSSQRKFMKMSEDPAAALSAFHVRTQLNRIEVYDKALNDGQTLLTEAETSISTINDIASDAMTELLQAVNGTNDDASRKALAQSLRGDQERILGAANTQLPGKFIFGGENFEDTPFTLSSSGDLLYHGQNVDTGSFPDEYRYVDIGIGLSVSGGGTVSPQSAMNTAYSGAVLLGTGTDSNGLPNNLYQLLGEIAGKLESGDLTDIQTYSDKLEDRANDIRMQYVSIGEKTNYISFFTNRLDQEKNTAAAKQNSLEVLGLDEGAIRFSEQQLVYNACLQMGTKILQPSLLDYLS